MGFCSFLVGLGLVWLVLAAVGLGIVGLVLYCCDLGRFWLDLVGCRWFWFVAVNPGFWVLVLILLWSCCCGVWV